MFRIIKIMQALQCSYMPITHASNILNNLKRKMTVFLLSYELDYLKVNLVDTHDYFQISKRTFQNSYLTYLKECASVFIAV